MEFPAAQGVAALVLVTAIQGLKKWRRFPWLADNAGWAGRGAAMIGALLAGAGIHFGWEASAGVFTISGLTAGNLGNALGDAFEIFVFGEAIYKNAGMNRVTPLPPP